MLCAETFQIGMMGKAVLVSHGKRGKKSTAKRSDHCTECQSEHTAKVHRCSCMPTSTDAQPITSSDLSEVMIALKMINSHYYYDNYWLISFCINF